MPLSLGFGVGIRTDLGRTGIVSGNLLIVIIKRSWFVELEKIRPQNQQGRFVAGEA
jgi:hypothetical protein